MMKTILGIVARISSRIFLGPELCRNPAWLRITVDYTMNLFFGVMAPKKWRRLLHPIVWRFVPEVRKVRQQIEEAVRPIQPVLNERIAESQSSAASSSKTKYTDAIQWACELADGRPYHLAKAGLFKLKLMDSFVKESQRLKPGAMREYLSSCPLI
jgi:hypothetical protein